MFKPKSLYLQDMVNLIRHLPKAKVDLSAKVANADLCHQYIFEHIFLNGHMTN